MEQEEIVIDLITFHTIEECQKILAEYIMPDSNITAEDCIGNLLGVLDNKALVNYMNNIKTNIKPKEIK